MLETRRCRHFLWLWLAVLVLCLDQYTKHLAVMQLQLHEPISLLPFFNLTLSYNSGAAFNLLHNAGGWQQWLFSAIALIVSLVILVWLYRLPSKHKWSAVALTLILGGAIGNFYDRVTLGYVIDFIQVHYQDWYFPIFNVADSAISIGAVMLLIEIWRS